MFAKKDMQFLYFALIAAIALSIAVQCSLAWPVEETTTQLTTDFPEHPSMIGRVIDRLCASKLQPLVDNITSDGKEFSAGPFCTELGQQGNSTCLRYLVPQCDIIPNEFFKDICKTKLVPWLCK